MSTASTHRPPGQTDAEFVTRLADHYAPPPLSPGQRAAWHARLAARLETRRPRRVVFISGLATAAAAVALVFSLGGWFGFESGDPPVRPAPVVSATQTRTLVVSAEDSVSDLTDDWEYLLALQPADDEEDGQLPDDYAAIASIFLES